MKTSLLTKHRLSGTFLFGSQGDFVSLGFLCYNAILALSRTVVLTFPKAVMQTTTEIANAKYFVLFNTVSIVCYEMKMDKFNSKLNCFRLRW